MASFYASTVSSPGFMAGRSPLKWIVFWAFLSQRGFLCGESAGLNAAGNRTAFSAVIRLRDVIQQHPATLITCNVDLYQVAVGRSITPFHCSKVRCGESRPH